MKSVYIKSVNKRQCNLPYVCLIYLVFNTAVEMFYPISSLNYTGQDSKECSEMPCSGYIKELYLCVISINQREE